MINMNCLARLLVSALLLAAILLPASIALNSETKDEIVGGTPDPGIKCTTACSSCGNPCNQHPPPPPPPPATPPPPKSPSKNYCPPPPAAPYIYVTAPPGNLYPLDPYFSSAEQDQIVKLPVLIGCWILGLVAVFWRF